MNIILSHIISPEQLTEIVIEHAPISFMELVKLLSVAVNIHRIRLDYVSIDKINPVTIQQNEIFQLVSKNNVVKNLTLKYEHSVEKVELLFALCPRLQYLALHDDCASFLIPLIKLILSKTNNNNRHLSSLCISKETDETEETLKMVIKNDKLIDDYMVECIDNKVYVWCGMNLAQLSNVLEVRDLPFTIQ
ncbi:unnamed protein product [Adineta steineri]|uniref:Uncharacterized protein n=1 Tax=Adineta steineri TaxID=433720 RepID=A0A816G2V0_9BILA|nr:unnamed protein product [Adineta steineri]CAF1668526.1 unnamed protein product [Adineta steineri]